MNDQDASPTPTPDALGALVDQLLACGGPLSQMICHMQESDASGTSAPDAPPILEIAHTLIRDVSAGVEERYTDQEIRTSAAIVEEVTNAICENIYFIPPSEIRRVSRGSRPPGARRRPRRSGRGRR